MVVAYWLDSGGGLVIGKIFKRRGANDLYEVGNVTLRLGSCIRRDMIMVGN